MAMNAFVFVAAQQQMKGAGEGIFIPNPQKLVVMQLFYRNPELPGQLKTQKLRTPAWKGFRGSDTWNFKASPKNSGLSTEVLTEHPSPDSIWRFRHPKLSGRPGSSGLVLKSKPSTLARSSTQRFRQLGTSKLHSELLGTQSNKELPDVHGVFCVSHFWSKRVL